MRKLFSRKAKSFTQIKFKQHLTGFTLVELMVVILIISMLTVVVVYSVAKAQRNGRDSRRKADIASIGGALESYYAQNKAYPDSSGSSCGTSTDNWACDSYAATSNSIWIIGSPNNLASIVDNLGQDPLRGNAGTTSTAALALGYNSGPLANTQELNHFYGYYSQNISATLNSGAVADCPYQSFCILTSGLAYTAGQYYILAAILENSSDTDSIRNQSSTYNVNCDQMNSSDSYNQNAFVKIKVY